MVSEIWNIHTPDVTKKITFSNGSNGTASQTEQLNLLYYPIDIYLTWNLHVISKELGAIVRELIYAIPRILRDKFWKQK